VIIWDPRLLSGSSTPPDRTTGVWLVVVAAVAALVLAFPRIAWWSGRFLPDPVQDLKTSVSTLSGNVTGVDGKITDLASAINATDLAKLTRDLGTMEAAVAALQDSVTSLQTAVNKIEQSCANLMSETSAAAGELAAVKAAVVDPTAQTADTILARLAAIERKLA
jgi:hypothetical protein